MKKKLLVWLLALVMMISAIAVGTVIATSADSMEITLNVTPVAQIGETQYRTLHEAVEAAKDGETVNLLADIYLMDWLVIDKPITIDGNGHFITGSGEEGSYFISASSIQTAAPSAKHLIEVQSAGVVIKNAVIKTSQYERATVSVGSGSLTLRDCTVEHLIFSSRANDAIALNGELIVEGNLIIKIGTCIRAYDDQGHPALGPYSAWGGISFNNLDCKLTFAEGSTVEFVDERDVDCSFQAMVHIWNTWDCNAENRAAAFAKVIGAENVGLTKVIGTGFETTGYIQLGVKGSNADELAAKWYPYRANGVYYTDAALANLAEGYVWVKSVETYGENTYTVYNAVPVGDVAGIINDEYGALVLPADVVAQIAGTNRYYTDLQTAFDAAKDGDTVLQLADIGSMETPYEGYLRITKSITFDMDGHSIVSKRDRVLRVTWSSDDVIANGEKIFDVTLKNGTIKAISNATHNGDSWGPMLIRGYGEINIEDMNFYNERYYGNGIYIGAVYGWTSDFDNTLTVNFRDCTFDSCYGGGLEVEGRFAPVTVNLYECTLTQTYPDPQTPWTSVNVAASFGGTLNVYNSTLTSANFGVYVYTSGGTINVYGGTINMGEVIASSDPDTYGAGAISTINLYGGTLNTEHYTLDSYNGGIVSINLYPGAIVVTKDEAIAVPEGYVVAKVEDGYIAALATDCEIVVDGKYGYSSVDDIDEVVVAQIVGTGYYFTDLQKAFDAAEGSKASIVLLKDVLGDFVIAEKTEITLDLNGKTIRSFNTDEENINKENYDVALTNNGTLNLNLNDGRIVAHRYGIVNNGTMTIGGDGFVYTVGCYQRRNNAVVNYGTAVINGGTYGDTNNDKTDANPFNIGYALVSSKGTVTVNGGNFTACDNYQSTTINDGGYAYAIGANGGILTINNANVYGANNGNAFCDAGKVFIYGGTFELARYRNNNCYYCLYDGNGASIYVYGGTFKNFSANGIVSTQEPSDNFNGSTFIYGGTFHGNKIGANTKSFFVSGGTYNLDPTAYVVEGYKVLCEEGTAEGFSSDHLWTVVMIVEEPTPDSSSDTQKTDETIEGQATIISNVSESLAEAIPEKKLEELLDTDSDLITDLIAEVNEVVKADQNAAQDTTEASKTDEDTSINKILAVAVTPQGTQQGETAATTVFVFDVKPTLTVTVEKTYTSGEDVETVTKTATTTVTNKDLDGETYITFVLPATGIADGTYLDVYHIDPVEGKTVKVGTFRVENGKVEVKSKTFSTFFYNINDEATLAVATAQQEAAATIDPQQYEDEGEYYQALEEAMAQAAEDTLAELAQEAAPDTTGYVAYIRVDNGIVLFETVSEAIAYNEANEANDTIVLLTDINENIIVVDGTTFTIDKSAHNYKFNANYVPNDSYLFMSVDTDSANNVFSVEFWQQKLILDLNGYTVTGYTDGQVTPIYISIYDEDEETYVVKESYPFEQIVGWKDGIPHYLTGWTVSYTPVEGDEVVLDEQPVDFETFTGAQFINVVDHAIYLQPQWAPFVAGIIGMVDVEGTNYTVNTADYNKDDPANYFTSAKTALTSVENFEIITLYADVANLWNVMLRHIPAIDLEAKEGRFFVDRNGGYDYQLNIGLDGLAVRHLSTIEDQSEVAYEDIDEYYFKDNRFLLTFDLNGGEIDPAAQLEGSINLNNTLLGIDWVAATYNTVPTKAGLTFAGWYIDADTALTDAIVMPAEDLTIYAMWTLDDATITGVEEDPEEEFDGILSKTYDLATDDIVAAHEAQVTYQWYTMTADGPVAIEGANTDTKGFRNVAESGIYMLKVTYTDHFGEQTKSYVFDVEIAPKDISGLATDETLALEYSSDLTYNAEEQSPTIDEFTYTVGDESEDVTYEITENVQTNAGDYQMTLTGTDNYTGSLVKDWAIARKAVTITVNDPGTKVYGDDDPTFTATVTGNVAADQYVIVYTLARAEGEDIGDYTVSITAEATQGNYTVTATDTKTFTITPATVTVTADTKEKVYGANDPVLTANVEGLKLEDTLDDITYTLSRAEGENVGTYVITPAGEATQGNYTVTYVTDNLTISAKALSENVTLTLDADKTYTGVEQTMDIISVVYASAQGDKTLVEGTDYTIVSGTDKGTNATQYTLTIQGIGNYAGTLDKTWKIEKAVLTVTADNKSKTYGQLDPEFTYTATGMQNNEDAAELLEDTEIQFARQNANTNDVGTYDITPSGADAIDNYTITYVKGTLTINRAALTVTADNKSKTYGAADEALTWTATGLVNGDTQATLLEANALVVNISRVAGEAVSGSPYTITVTGAAEQGNYNVTYVNGGYTISKATITVTQFAQTNYEATTRGNTTASIATNAITKTISTVNNTPYTITYRLLPNANFAPVSDEFGAMPDFTNAPAGLYDLEYKITAENHNEATGNFTLKISVARVGNANVANNYYFSFCDAVQAAGNGATVTLLVDDSSDMTIWLDKSLNVNLNGSTYTYTTAGNTQQAFLIDEGCAEFNMYDGALVSASRGIVSNVETTIILTDVALTANTFGIRSTGSNSTIELTNDAIEATTAVYLRRIADGSFIEGGFYKGAINANNCGRFIKSGYFTVNGLTPYAVAGMAEVACNTTQDAAAIALGYNYKIGTATVEVNGEYYETFDQALTKAAELRTANTSAAPIIYLLCDYTQASMEALGLNYEHDFDLKDYGFGDDAEFYVMPADGILCRYSATMIYEDDAYTLDSDVKVYQNLPEYLMSAHYKVSEVIAVVSQHGSNDATKYASLRMAFNDIANGDFGMAVDLKMVHDSNENINVALNYPDIADESDPIAIYFDLNGTTLGGKLELGGYVTIINSAATSATVEHLVVEQKNPLHYITLDANANYTLIEVNVGWLYINAGDVDTLINSDNTVINGGSFHNIDNQQNLQINQGAKFYLGTYDNTELTEFSDLIAWIGTFDVAAVLNDNDNPTYVTTAVNP